MINLFIAQNKPIKTLETVTIDFFGQMYDGYVSQIQAMASKAVDTNVSCTIRVTKEIVSGRPPVYDQITIGITSGQTIGIKRVLSTEKIITFSVTSITPTQSNTQQYVVGEVIAPN